MIWQWSLTQTSMILLGSLFFCFFVFLLSTSHPHHTTTHSQDVAITHLAFSPEYARAVEDKQVALQESERAKYIVLGAQQEKKTIITRARGEAESAELIGQAVKKNPGFMKLRRIDAARDIADVVAKSGNKVYLSADSLLLNLLGDADDKFEKSIKKRF